MTFKVQYFNFRDNTKYLPRIDCETFTEALSHICEDAAVLWDRDVGADDMPPVIRMIEIVKDETWPELWGIGNVTFEGEQYAGFGVTMHYRLVEWPEFGLKWIKVEGGISENIDTPWNNYANCVKLMRPLRSFEGNIGV